MFGRLRSVVSGLALVVVACSRFADVGTDTIGPDKGRTSTSSPQVNDSFDDGDDDAGADGAAALADREA
jgi:hypothetical protein